MPNLSAMITAPLPLAALTQLDKVTGLPQASSYPISWHGIRQYCRGSPGVSEHQNVFTVHIRSFLSIPFRINVEDEGYQDLIGYETCIFVVEYDVRRIY
jgi:hypothetical protein